MLGSEEEPLLKTKGMETWGLVLFCVHLLGVYRPRFGGDGPALLRAGEALVRHMEILDEHSNQLPHRAIQELHDTMLQHLTAIRDLDIQLPKHHMWTHMVKRAYYNGNPRMCANFYNEHLNKPLKAACRNASQATFESTVLFKMQGALRSIRAKRKGRT